MIAFLLFGPYRAPKYPSLLGGWPGYGAALIVVGLLVLSVNHQIGGVLVGLGMVCFGAVRLCASSIRSRRHNPAP